MRTSRNYIASLQLGQATYNAPVSGRRQLSLPRSFVNRLSRMSYLAVDLKNEDLLKALQEMRSQHESVIIDGGRAYRVRTEARQKNVYLKVHSPARYCYEPAQFKLFSGHQP
jgi:hypothetical protein